MTVTEKANAKTNSTSYTPLKFYSSSKPQLPTNKKHSVEKPDFRTILKTAFRTVTSLAIPMTLALFLSLFATFVFHANQDATYFYNAWYLFCKLFFPSTPLMMWFITKK
ncbi:MAG: hypothetical protein WCQ67_06125 [Treponema sp.]